MLRSLARQHPETESQLFSEDGELNRYVNVYLNDEDVRVLDGLDTSVSDGDTVVILPAMAGGAPLTVRPRPPRGQGGLDRVWLDSAHAGFSPLLPEGHEYPTAPGAAGEQLLADPAVSVLVAEGDDGGLLGYVGCGDNRDPDSPPEAGEVRSMFVALRALAPRRGRGPSWTRRSTTCASAATPPPCLVLRRQRPRERVLRAAGLHARRGGAPTDEAWASLPGMRYRRNL